MTATRRRPKCQTCGSVDRGIRGRVGRGMFFCRDEWHQATPKVRAALTEGTEGSPSEKSTQRAEGADHDTGQEQHDHDLSGADLSRHDSTVDAPRVTE